MGSYCGGARLVITSLAEMTEAFNNYFVSVGKSLADEISSLEPTSFPGSSLLWRKDPGRGWSRVTQILRGKLKLSHGAVVEESVCCVWKIEILCVIVSGDENVICNKKS